MKKILCSLSLLALFPALSLAQAPERRGWGYTFAGVGGVSNRDTAYVNFGGGGERLIYKGLGMGAEVGVFAPSKDLGNGIGILSVNPSYHFGNATRSGKVVPFV